MYTIITLVQGVMAAIPDDSSQVTILHNALLHVYQRFPIDACQIMMQIYHYF